MTDRHIRAGDHVFDVRKWIAPEGGVEAHDTVYFRAKQADIEIALASDEVVLELADEAWVLDELKVSNSDGEEAETAARVVQRAARRATLPIGSDAAPDESDEQAPKPERRGTIVGVPRHDD